MIFSNKFDLFWTTINKNNQLNVKIISAMLNVIMLMVVIMIHNAVSLP